MCRRRSLPSLKNYENKSSVSSGLFSSVAKIFPGVHSYQDLWDSYLLPIIIPLLIGLGGGVLVALLIARELWAVALAFVFIVPTVIVLNRYPLAVILISLTLALTEMVIILTMQSLEIWMC